MFDRNKKGPGDSSTDSTPAPSSFSSPVSSSADVSSARPATPAPTSTTSGGKRSTAVIGPSIQIDGHVRGQEDLFVEGEITGTVHLESHTLTIGNQGKVKADVFAQSVFVEGSMEGDLYGSEQVIIRKSAKVRGNVTAPRVTLEDGASFKGSIEMDPDSVKNALAPNSTRGSTNVRPAAAVSTTATPLGSVSSQSR